MSKADFYIVYDGPALSGSQMDVEDLAPALLALRSLLHEANAEIYKSDMSIQLKVRATFQTGCFGIDLIAVQSVLKNILSLFNSDEVNGALNLLALLGLTGAAAVTGRRGLLSVIQWIRGRKIDKVTVHSDNMATIEIDDDRLEVEMQVINLLKNQKVRQSVEKLIVKPLEQEGIDSFATSGGNAQEGEFIIITKEEIEYFKSPAVEDEPIEEVEYVATYEIISPVFQEDNKWRMSDGESSFYMEILDKDFMTRVQNSEETFAKGDLLKISFRESKVLTPSGLKVKRQALKILDHRSRAIQLPLPFEYKD